MCPLMIWRKWNPDRSAHPRRWALMLALLIAVSLGIARGASAQSPIEVISSQQDYEFSQSLDFSLVAKSASPIVDVTLFFGRQGERLVRRVYPDFQPGPSVNVAYQEELESGQYAPGTVFRVWWQLKTDDGATLTTEPQTFEYTDRNQDWQKLAGQRVDLFWYGREQANAKKLLERAEEAISRLESDIGIVVEHRVRIYVYNSQNDMSRALSPRSAGYDDRVLTLGVAVGEDALILLGTHRDSEMIVAHELSHIVVGLATDNPYAGLPRWLDEGLAMYAEGEMPEDNQRALDQGVKDDALLSVRSMTSYSGQASQVDLFYGQAYSIVDFLLQEYGRDKLHELLAVFAKGSRQEDALQQVYGYGLDELDTRWRASLGLGPRRPAAESAPQQPAEQGQRNAACPLGMSLLAAPALAGAVVSGSLRRRARP